MRTIALFLSLGLLFAIPWENSIVIGGLGSAARLIGLAATAFWLGMVLIKGGFRRIRPIHVAIFLFFTWNIASYFWSRNPERTLVRVQTYLQLFIFILLLWDLYATPKAVRAAMQAYILGGYVTIAGTLLNYFSATGFRGGVRFAASGFDPNDMAMLLTMGIPMAWYLAVSAGENRSSHLLRIVNYLYIPGAILANLLAASRTSFVAILVAGIFILFSFTRLRLLARIILFAGLVYMLIALQPLIPETSIQRLSTTRSSIAAGDLTGRTRIWRAGYRIFTQNPVGGIGSGAFRSTIELDKAPHNVYVAILTETGLVGILLFGFILLTIVQQILRHPTWWERGVWLTLLAIWLIGSITLNWEYRKITWLLFSLIICSANAAALVPTSTHKVVEWKRFRASI